MIRKTMYFIMPAHLKNLSVVDEPLTALFADWPGVDVSESTVYDIKLAVQELCTNIVNHAYEGKSGKIRLQIVVYEDPPSVVINSQDEGVNTFDLDGWRPPTLDEPQVHGLGMFLIRELMDEVSYQPSPGNNRWCLVKRLTRTGDTQAAACS